MKYLLVFSLFILPYICTAQFSEVSDSVQWNIKALDTGREVTYMTKREKDMLRELNMVRAYPHRYIAFIEEHIRNQENESGDAIGGISYTTTTTFINGKTIVTVDTMRGQEVYREELKAARELVAELKTMKPAPILKPRECIYKAASKHGKDCVKRGELEHTGSDGSGPWDRISKECNGMDGNENLAGGPSSVRQIVINLLVDSGIPGRGHRYNMLDKNWTYGACYETGEVGIYPTGWVQNFGR